MKAGFSLVEMVIAVALVLLVLGGVFTLTNPAHPVFEAQPVAIEMQQRLRVAIDAMTNDLLAAGAGLRKYVAPVLPFRRGLLSADPPGSFSGERISLLYAAGDAAVTTLRAPTDGTDVVQVNPQPGCGAAKPLCGFAVASLAIVFDDSGVYDTFHIASIQDQGPAVVRSAGPWSKSYAAGSTLTSLVSATYWLRADASKGTSELMKYDGRVTDVPLADEIVHLAFEYFGDPVPATLRRPLADPVGPWTSYGPKPPLPTEDDVATPGYGVGENCVFQMADGATVPRLAVLGAPPSLVLLAAAELTDGPWCPDPLAATRFDADLLRIRRIRVTLRVRPVPTAVQKPDAQEITFDVTPRNLSLLQ